jgi:hypothetical protein
MRRAWQEAMGANVVNTVAEGVAPMLARIGHCRVGLRILSNMALLRTATASFRLRVDQLAYRGTRPHRCEYSEHPCEYSEYPSVPALWAASALRLVGHSTARECPLFIKCR